MSISVNWDNDESRSIIRVTLDAPEAWDAIEEGYRAVYALMEQGGAKVDVIIDVRDAPGPGKPTSFIALVRAYLNAPSNAGTCVLIGASPVTRVLAQNFMQSADWHYRIDFAESLTDAHQRIAEHNSTRKPAMQRAWTFTQA
jgi:hypothetical protein